MWVSTKAKDTVDSNTTSTVLDCIAVRDERKFRRDLFGIGRRRPLCPKLVGVDRITLVRGNKSAIEATAEN